LILIGGGGRLGAEAQSTLQHGKVDIDFAILRNRPYRASEFGITYQVFIFHPSSRRSGRLGEADGQPNQVEYTQQSEQSQQGNHRLAHHFDLPFPLLSKHFGFAIAHLLR
jgi:hypothetical protein